jgi:hypothetical protein
MSIHHTRRVARWLTAVCLVNLFVVSCGTQAVRAQSSTGDSGAVVEVPVHQLNQIQQELRYLRERDAQRQVWEESVVKRLPPANFAFASESYGSGEEVYLDSPTLNKSQKSDCGGKSCGCCGKGCSCLGGQCPAPCIDCPHVSTLSPYFNIRIFGALKLDMLFSEARAVAPGTPYFLLPESIAGLSQTSADIHGRQSSLGAAFQGPQIGCLQTGGLLLAYFYNDNALADAYGILPLQAWGELKNENWRFAAGYMFDVFNPNAPTILPFSILCGSGNTGNASRGMVRLERYLHPSDSSQWTLQFALSEPITTVYNPEFSLSEDNGWPNVEGRVALGLGCLEAAGMEAQRPFEIGLSGVIGQVRNTVPAPGNPAFVDRFVADVWGVGVDFRWKVNDVFGFMGELYTGRGLGTYNGAVQQIVNPDNSFQGIRSTGGWLETFVYWTPCLHSHFGYGIDDPRDGDVPVTAAFLGRTENSTVYSNLIWDVTESFRVAFEVSWRETLYRNPLVPDNDGVFFHTQFAWNF